MNTRYAGVALGLILAAAAPAAAQQIQWTDRIFVNVSAGDQPVAHRIETDQTFTIYGEDGDIRASRKVGNGLFVDGTVGARLMGHLGVAVSYARREKKSNASITAQVPDPIFYDSPRTVDTTVNSLTHREAWVMPQAVWFVPVGEKIDLFLMAGPAVVWVGHAVAEVSTVTEAAGGPQLDTMSRLSKQTAVGGVIGIDGRYMFAKHLGAGLLIRYTHARAEVVTGKKVTVGGPEIGLGVRIPF